MTWAVGERMKTTKNVTVTAIVIIVVGLLLVWTNHQGGTKLDYQKLFNDKATDLTKMARGFVSQNKIVSINRYDSSIVGLSYSIRRTFNQEKNNNVTFEVLSDFKNNEEAYWNKKPSEIISTKGTGSTSLESYLKLSNMTLSEFLQWRNFLSKYNLTYIAKDNTKELITIGLTDKSGYIYRPNSSIEPGYTKVIQLNENWYYFTEK
jgi:hypothetical protein